MIQPHKEGQKSSQISMPRSAQGLNTNPKFSQITSGFSSQVKFSKNLYAYFYFSFDFFCDLFVIQQRVVQPPFVGVFNIFSPVIEI